MLGENRGLSLREAELGEEEADKRRRSKKRAISSEVGEERFADTQRRGERGEGHTRKEEEGNPTYASKVKRGAVFGGGEQIADKQRQVEEMLRRWTERSGGEEAEEPETEEEGSEEERRLCPTIRLSKERIQKLSEPWWGALIVKVLGRRVGVDFLQKRLQASWRPVAEMRTIVLGNDYFLIRFSSWQDRERIISGGPWTIYGHFLSIREWSPAFNADEARIDRAVVWARIPGLPMEFYNEDCLRLIGDKLGTTIKIDAGTAELVKGRFLRICIQIDLSRSLVAKFKLNNRLFKVEYEGLGLVCFSCGRVGHRSDGCTSRAPADQVMKGKEKGTENGASSREEEGRKKQLEDSSYSGKNSEAPARSVGAEEGHHGPWMLVPPRRRLRG